MSTISLTDLQRGFQQEGLQGLIYASCIMKNGDLLMFDLKVIPGITRQELSQKIEDYLSYTQDQKGERHKMSPTQFTNFKQKIKSINIDLITLV